MLIELLVVVAIISLLSSIALASFQGAREDARVTKTVRDFQEIEKALQLHMTQNGYTDWRQIYGYGEYGLLPLKSVINQTTLSEQLSVAPSADVGDGKYRFSNTGSIEHNSPQDCSGGYSSVQGLGISVRRVNDSTDKKIDNIVDGGDGGGWGV